MKYFVTSNLQLGRPGAIKLYKRPYDSVEEMNADLILKWNSVVEPGDVVYHLGNFAWDPKTAQDALNVLNGQIFFILGETDQAIVTLREKKMLPANAAILRDITRSQHPECQCVFSYWPLGDWEKSSKTWSVIGYPKKKFKSDPIKRIINASTDLWGNKPQDLDKLVGIFKDF
jgi:calcineurin-like phosphoesterase family protein